MNTPTRGEKSTGSNHFWNNFAATFNTYLILRILTYNFIGNFLKISRNVLRFLKVFRCNIFTLAKISTINFH